MRRSLHVLLLSCCLVTAASACPVHLGVKGGSSIPDLRDNGGNEFSSGWSSRVGFFFGLSADVEVSPVFSVQAEANYSAQGGRKDGLQAVSLPDFPMTLYANFKNTAKLDYVEIPVLARFHIGPARRFFADLGPYVGILLSAKNVTEGSSRLFTDAAGQTEVMVPVDPNDPGQGYIPLGTQNLGGTTDNKSSLRAFNWGIQGGAGVTRPLGRGAVSLEVRGELGLANIQKHPDVDGKNSTGALIVALGYSMPVGAR